VAGLAGGGEVKTGLVLLGGGASAAYEVGVIKAIYTGRCPAAGGVRPQVFCGRGAGGFNCAVVASRYPGQSPDPAGYLESLWADEIPQEGKMRNTRVFRRRLDTAQFFDFGFMWRRPFKSWKLYFGDLWSLMTQGSSPEFWQEMSPMQRLIRESIDISAIRAGENDPEHTRILRVIAVERGSGSVRVFRNRDFTEEAGHAVIQASCALPGVFPAVAVEGKPYVACGPSLADLMQAAVDEGCEAVHLVHNVPKGEEGEQSLGRFERPIEGRRLAIHQYRPRRVLVGKAALLAFSRETIRAAIAEGAADAAAHDCAAAGCIR
jgi:predicted acylesterase/phospholipase RssA